MPDAIVFGPSGSPVAPMLHVEPLHPVSVRNQGASSLLSALSRVYVKARAEDSKPANESPGPRSLGPGLFLAFRL